MRGSFLQAPRWNSGSFYFTILNTDFSKSYLFRDVSLLAGNLPVVGVYPGTVELIRLLHPEIFDALLVMISFVILQEKLPLR